MRNVRRRFARVKRGSVCLSPGFHTLADMLSGMTPTPLLLHADEHLLVICKPAGLLAVPGRGEAGLVNLAAWVQQQHADALIVHRLDQATSGLMVLARGAAAQRALSMAFEARQVDKQYIAVVHGDVAGESGEIDAPLVADWPHRPRQIVDTATGKPALTRWRVLQRAEGRTRLVLEPITGRTHQLRVHLQSIGHAIVGDALYGPQPPAHPRLLLHATQLTLRHPASGAACTWTHEPPF